MQAGLSQTELAERAGVSQPAVSAYEFGRRDPSMAMLAKMIEATGHELRVEVAPGRTLVRGLPDTPMGRRLRRHRRAVKEIALRRGATNVRVFGSVARGEDSDTSESTCWWTWDPEGASLRSPDSSARSRSCLEEQLTSSPLQG